MRKLKLQMQVSVDGFVAGPNREMDWMVWDWDDRLKRHVLELTRPVDTILLGRVLAEGFIPHWTAAASNPQTSDAFSRHMTDTPKVVFTRTLQASKWAKTTIARGPLREEVNALKATPGGDIIAYGGGQFVSSLIRENLVDEYHLFINPAALGAGIPIFTHVDKTLRLKLHEAVPFACGIVALSYIPTPS